jgi:hypothetical protein
VTGHYVCHRGDGELLRLLRLRRHLAHTGITR